MLEQAKVDRLHEAIARLGSVAVAFSGGADSTLLLAYSLKVLGPEHMLAITANSSTLPRRELDKAQALARDLSARHLIVERGEMHDERFATNPPDGCFYCKQELFARMRRVVDEECYQHLVYGATADDTGDFRPGMRAAQEAGAMAPLLDAGFGKQDVRDLSRQLGLHGRDGRLRHRGRAGSCHRIGGLY